MGHRIADALVEFLFSTGDGEQADRLVLTVAGPTVKELGGWSRQAVKAAILAVLKGYGGDAQKVAAYEETLNRIAAWDQQAPGVSEPASALAARLVLGAFEAPGKERER